MDSDRYLIIHGHFYQPPRENPWTLCIEPQISAAPFENWNMRINRECYAPNSRSNIIGADQRITRVVNNYQYLSSNFGPTLLNWMEKADPETYALILEADRQGALTNGGHGPALAQVYNHMIMPLANLRDRVTQVRWGIADFKARFGRDPEGMWLSETAVDLDTAKLLAQEGLKFTILAQGQADMVRPLGAGGQAQQGDGGWVSVAGGGIDPREPYRVFWGPGSKDYLDVFFYDGQVSRSIAFEELLRDGSNFLNRIEQAFGQSSVDGQPRLVNLATDGESYGHHFSFGDMALAWLFTHLENHASEPGSIKLTNYGQYLEMFPPRNEVRLVNKSSWSCIHGVERWRSDCGCHTGGPDGWNQKWRKPLREGLDWLRDGLAEIYEEQTKGLLIDPWAARNDYFKLLMSHYDPQVQQAFLEEHQKQSLSKEEGSLVLTLLESQLMALYMFTSCGWFFDDVAGIEPVQNLGYAFRAIELVKPWDQAKLMDGFMKYLQDIQPNQDIYDSGLDIWEKMVLPNKPEKHMLAALWAVSTLLEAPEALTPFTTPSFVPQKTISLGDGELLLLAGQVDLNYQTLGETKSCLCLALYAPGGYVGVLVDEAPEVLPPWFGDQALSDTLGYDLQSMDSFKVWGDMAKLMPGASSYTMDDLPPQWRSVFLKDKVSDIYTHIKGHIREIFNFNRYILTLYHSGGQLTTWMERCVFRVMSEYELQRILGPAEKKQPVNCAALDRFLKQWGAIREDEISSPWSQQGHYYLDLVFASLAKMDRPLEPLLEEIICLLGLVKEVHHSVDLWSCQNRWHGLVRNKTWMARLEPRELELMSKLGEVLTFVPLKDLS